MQQLEDNSILKLAVKVAIEDGVSVAEVLDRGAMDLKLRIAFTELTRKAADNGSN